MASYTFTPIKGTEAFKVQFDRLGKILPKGPTYSAASMLEDPQLGPRDWFPTGADFAPRMPFATRRGRG